MADPYATLGVSRNASADDIRKAYRKLAREYHPDTSAHENAEERFKQINAAYETLSDPERRQRYDMFGDDGSRAASAGPGGGFGGFGDLGDLMETFFGGSGFGTRRPRGPRSVAQRGLDIETTLRLAFAESVFGVNKEIEVYAPGLCDACKGSGLEEGSARVTCPACQGAGEIRTMQRSLFGAMMTARPCSRCEGSGLVPEKPCRTCGGDGRVMRSMRVTVEVPAGVEHGTTLRVRGRGETGVRGGEAGDLFVHIGVEPDSVFHRDGDDLICRITVPVTQAILGGSMTLPTLDGQEEIEFEPGTQPGTVVRVRGKGVPHLGGRGRGDLVIGIDVDIPRKLSGEQRDLVRKLAELRNESTSGGKANRKRGLKDVLRGS
ncbi:MAG: molecular chaperone DnaJ [Actinomycetota bacterium]